ncbi:MAG: glycosyltransferase family 4 protein [Nanoarchaeota archaeon]|nr:glycosyltransferase family 4 protein [Nanoarchaeota archaeon]
MKLAILCRYFPKDCIGGGENYIYEIWKRAKWDFDVELISGWKNSPYLLPKEAHKINLSQNNPLINYWKFYKGSKSFLKKIKPDLIQSTCYEYPSLGNPEVITVCHLGHLMGKIGNNLKLSMQKKFAIKKFKKADKLIAISRSTMNDLLKLGLDKEKINLAYTGINVKNYSIKKTNNDKFTIIYPSRISREKGQHIAIEAFKRLPEKVKRNCKLQIVGFVNDKKYLNEIERDSGKNVEVITNVPRIEDYIMNSDLVLFPTLMWEGFGIVAGEALACEKPLISSEFPSIREVCGEYGLWIKPGDINDLAKKIENVYSDKSLRKKISSGGRQWIIDNFSWDKVYSEHKKVWEEVVG